MSRRDRAARTVAQHPLGRRPRRTARQGPRLSDRQPLARHRGLHPAGRRLRRLGHRGGVRYGAAVSIGNNPTFEGVPQRQVEAHLLDQSLDLYGETIELEFVDYVRPMRKFDSADALAGQMRADEVRIREILGVASRA